MRGAYESMLCIPHRSLSMFADVPKVYWTWGLDGSESKRKRLVYVEQGNVDYIMVLMRFGNAWVNFS